MGRLMSVPLMHDGRQNERGERKSEVPFDVNLYQPFKLEFNFDLIDNTWSYTECQSTWS